MKVAKQVAKLTALCALAVCVGSLARAANPLPPPAIASGTQFYPIFGRAALINNGGLGVNTVRCSVFYWPWTSHVDKASLNISVTGTAPVNFAIYTDAIDYESGRHQPQVLLTDPGLAFSTASTGDVTVGLGVPGVGIGLLRGLYWICNNSSVQLDTARWAVITGPFNYQSSILGSANPVNASANSNMQALYLSNPSGGVASVTPGNWPASYVGQPFNEAISPSASAISLEIATMP